MNKYRACIIGAGKVGTALANHLHVKRIQVEQIIDNNLQSAKHLAAKVKVKLFTDRLDEISEKVNLIIISVQDRNIFSVVNELSKSEKNLKNVFICHTSGSETSEIFKPLRILGVEVFSFHPLFSFASKKFEYDLSNSFVAIESNSRAAINFAKKFCTEINVNSLVIKKEEKSLYHAFAVLISNYLALMLGQVEKSRIVKSGKIKVANIYKPLVESTLTNIEFLGIDDGLTGPIVRGDNETIKKNILALKEYSSDLASIYKKFIKLVK